MTMQNTPSMSACVFSSGDMSEIQSIFEEVCARFGFVSAEGAARDAIANSLMIIAQRGERDPGALRAEAWRIAEQLEKERSTLSPRLPPGCAVAESAACHPPGEW